MNDVTFFRWPTFRMILFWSFFFYYFPLFSCFFFLCNLTRYVISLHYLFLVFSFRFIYFMYMYFIKVNYRLNHSGSTFIGMKYKISSAKVSVMSYNHRNIYLWRTPLVKVFFFYQNTFFFTIIFEEFFLDLNVFKKKNSLFK